MKAIELHFTIGELVIDHNAKLPVHVANKLLRWHIAPMNPIRDALGAPIWASGQSGYRHKGWERSRNRAPDDPRNNRSSWSRHTFDPLEGKDPDGLGAIDWTTKRHLIYSLAMLLIRESPYSRICYYPDTDNDDKDDRFFHCDYGYRERGQTLFVNDGGWKQKTESEFLNIISNGR